eukprot:TRINITY_DN4569_c0_g1_i14.p2 TRINITY_DN4569_c0_g1~~TRINITY_DN4569_c0_g1_i14.p2  ORF type:complete len:120 (-),score=4.19 TRINITY_DN4569_c0_g1_i14:33-392(-)
MHFSDIALLRQNGACQIQFHYYKNGVLVVTYKVIFLIFQKCIVVKSFLVKSQELGKFQIFLLHGIKSVDISNFLVVEKLMLGIVDKHYDFQQTFFFAAGLFCLKNQCDICQLEKQLQCG